MIVLIAAACFISSAVLWNFAFNFTVDAAPVGSMMIAASVLLFGISLFLFGVAAGQIAHC